MNFSQGLLLGTVIGLVLGIIGCWVFNWSIDRSIKKSQTRELAERQQRVLDRKEHKDKSTLENVTNQIWRRLFDERTRFFGSQWHPSLDLCEYCRTDKAVIFHIRNTQKVGDLPDFVVSILRTSVEEKHILLKLTSNVLGAPYDKLICGPNDPHIAGFVLDVLRAVRDWKPVSSGTAA